MHDLEQLAHSKLRSRYRIRMCISSAGSQFASSGSAAATTTNSSRACMPNLHTMGELFCAGIKMRRLFDLSVMLHFVVSTTSIRAILQPLPFLFFFFCGSFFVNIILLLQTKNISCCPECCTPPPSLYVQSKPLPFCFLEWHQYTCCARLQL